MLVPLLALTSGALLSAAPVETHPPRVYVGVYLSDVSDLDLKAGRFKADVQLWCKWLGSSTPPALEFSNGELDSQDEVAREDDGEWHSLRWHVIGTFRGTFPLQRFPFDSQRLPITVALPKEAGELVPDLASSGMRPEFSITGWLYDPFFRAERSDEKVASDFGGIKTEGAPHRLQAVSFIVEMRRPFTAYALKFIFPLAIILAMAFLVFFVTADKFEVRSAIGITALLSCIAFHFSQADSLPPVAYLVAADKLFVGSYLLIFTSVAESLWVSRWFDRWPLRSRWIDRVSAVVFPLSAIVTVLVVMREATAERIAPPPRAIVSAAAPVTARRTLRVGTPGFSSLSINQIRRLAQRGTVVTDSAGVPQPFLVEAVPSLTNEYVRFSPSGGMRVIWRLRPGLRWSDGAAITASDVAYSAQMGDSVVQAVIQDPFTVALDFPRREAEALQGFTVYPRAKLEPITLDGGYDSFRKANANAIAASDGPFLFESFAANQRAVFKRNPFFQGGAPAFDTVEVRGFPSSKEASEALLAHEIDLISGISQQGVELLQGKPGIVVRESPSDTLYVLSVDLELPLFKDVRVRQALSHAVDRAAIGRVLVGSGAREAYDYRAETADDAANDIVRRSYAPDTARALLAQAGLTPPIPVTLVIPDVTASSSPAQAAAIIKRNLEAVGFQVQVTPSKTALDISQRKQGLGFTQITATASVSRFWGVPLKNGDYDSEHPHGPFDADIVALYARYKTTLIEERKRVLSQKLQRAWAERLPLIPLVFGVDHIAHSEYLMGLEPGRAKNIWWNAERWYFKPAGEVRSATRDGGVARDERLGSAPDAGRR